MKLYAGIGSRRAPDDVCQLCTRLADAMEADGWILRSGGADGCDSAFEAGVKDPAHKQIFQAQDATDEALYMASQYHPNWKACSPSARNLHARNMMQILGADLREPVAMVICWTPDACLNGRRTTRDTGGTGQALRLATELKIPIRNLAHSEHWAKAVSFLAERGYLLTP